MNHDFNIGIRSIASVLSLCFIIFAPRPGLHVIQTHAVFSLFPFNFCTKLQFQKKIPTGSIGLQDDSSSRQSCTLSEYDYDLMFWYDDTYMILEVEGTLDFWLLDVQRGVYIAKPCHHLHPQNNNIGWHHITCKHQKWPFNCCFTKWQDVGSKPPQVY